MELNLENLGERETYSLLTQTIIPRPIAWVLSQNTEITGQNSPTFNLAPFSFFNGAAAKPPLIMISVGSWDVNGRVKDTLINIRERKSFTVAIPSFEMNPLVQDSAAEFAYGESEIDNLGIELTEWDWFTPKISNCSVNFACTLKMELEPEGSSQTLIFAEISKIDVSDRVVITDEKDRIAIDPLLVDPLLRLGSGKYGRLGTVESIKRMQS